HEQSSSQDLAASHYCSRLRPCCVCSNFPPGILQQLGRTCNGLVSPGCAGGDVELPCTILSVAYGGFLVGWNDLADECNLDIRAMVRLSCRCISRPCCLHAGSQTRVRMVALDGVSLCARSIDFGCPVRVHDAGALESHEL